LECEAHYGFDKKMNVYHASIQMTMCYVHPADEQKRLAIEKFEKIRAEEIISTASAQQSHGVTTKVTSVERMN
jgi:hypothetical protein